MNSTGKGGFGERKHQINKKGKPRSFDALRKLAQQIAHDEIGANGMTVTEAILRKWAASTDPRLQIEFVHVAFGKPPAPVEVTGKDGKQIVMKVLYGDDGTGDPTS